MDLFFAHFKQAYGSGDGYALSMTLSPLDTQSQPDRLSSFFRSTNAASAVNEFKYRILYDNTNPLKLSQDEGNGWVDVYFAYWKVTGEILKAEAATKANDKVGDTLTFSPSSYGNLLYDSLGLLVGNNFHATHVTLNDKWQDSFACRLSNTLSTIPLVILANDY